MGPQLVLPTYMIQDLLLIGLKFNVEIADFLWRFYQDYGHSDEKLL